MAEGQRGLLAVYGAGGHGRAVAEAAGLSGWDVVGFLDDNPAACVDAGTRLCLDDPRLSGFSLIVGIGENAARHRLLASLAHRVSALATVIHPSAFVSPSASLADGVFVGPMAVVHRGASVGRGVIVNSGAVVEHDAVLAPCCHIAPGAVLGGGVSVGEASLVGLGARVLPGLGIGAKAVVAAGAVVLRDVGSGGRVAGVPAREMD